MVPRKISRCLFMFGDGTRCRRSSHYGCRNLCFVHCPDDPHKYRGPIGPDFPEGDQLEDILKVLWKIAKRVAALSGWFADRLPEIGVDDDELIGRLEAQVSEASAILDEAERFDEAGQVRSLVQVVTEFEPLLDQAVRAFEEAGAVDRLREFSMPEYASAT